MDSFKWIVMLILILNWKEEEAACKQESTPQPQDLFACKPSPLRQNSSVILSEVLTVRARWKKNPQKHAVNHVILCASLSPPHQYLQIRFEYFYDVCAVTTWTNISNLTDKNFKIQFSNSGHFWYYYTEMGQVKNFQGARNNSNVSLHHLQLTTKYIRFVPVKWESGSCLQFAIHGNIATCERSQRRMDLWCRNELFHNNASHARCSGDVRARFDRGLTLSLKLWRCYYESALQSDFSSYDDKLKSPCYETRHMQLKRLSKSCTNTSKEQKCVSPAQETRDRTNKSEGKTNISKSEEKMNVSESQEKMNISKSEEKMNISKSEEKMNISKSEEKMNISESQEKMNISEYIANFSQLVKAYEAKAQMSSRDILDAVHVLENVSPDELLRNATQQNRDLFAKNFLEIASTLFNETNIPTWTNSLLNSTTASRLLKVIEDFCVVFAKYLECGNKLTENGRVYAFSNLKFIAWSCIGRSRFPMKLFSSQGCKLDNVSSNACNGVNEATDTAIIPDSLMDEHQRLQVSFVSYKNAHRLFPVQSTMGNAHLRPVKVDSRIMSLSVKPDQLVSKENPVVVTFKPFSRNSENEKYFHCGFWNFSIAGTRSGAWSTDGCHVSSVNTSQVTCRCTHLTNFALLLQVTPDSNTQGIHKKVLKWMTYLGCSLSLAAEILCLLAFILLTKMKETKIKIHINLVACLAVGHLVFLTGVENAAGSKMICSIVAVTLHFFFLASFMWMLVEGIHLVSKVKTVFQPINKLGIAYALAYGLPLMIVGGTFAVKFNEYGTQKHCWLSLSSGTIWSFVIPVCGIILVNVVVLAFVLYRLTNTKVFSKQSDWKKIRVTVRASLVMIPMLGLSWFFGLLAINQDTIAFQYLFVGLNSLQGVFLFLFQCVVHEEVKGGFRNIMRRRRVTQQVTRIVSKARSNDQTPEDRHKSKRLSAKAAFSLPGITVVDHQIKVVQKVRLTKVIKRPQENSSAHQPDKASLTSVKFAWGKTSF